MLGIAKAFQLNRLVVIADGDGFARVDGVHGVQVIAEEPGAAEVDRGLALIEHGLRAVAVGAVEVLTTSVGGEDLGEAGPDGLHAVAVRADGAVLDEGLPETNGVEVDVRGSVVVVGIGGIIDELAVHVRIVAVVAFLSADDFDLGTGGLIGVSLSQPTHLLGPEGLEVARHGQRLIAGLGQLRADVHELAPGGGSLNADLVEDVDIVEPQNLNRGDGNAIPIAGHGVNVLQVERDLIRPSAVGIRAVVKRVLVEVDGLVHAVGARQVAVHDVGLGQKSVQVGEGAHGVKGRLRLAGAGAHAGDGRPDRVEEPGHVRADVARAQDEHVGAAGCTDGPQVAPLVAVLHVAVAVQSLHHAEHRGEQVLRHGLSVCAGRAAQRRSLGHPPVDVLVEAGGGQLQKAQVLAGGEALGGEVAQDRVGVRQLRVGDLAGLDVFEVGVGCCGLQACAVVVVGGKQYEDFRHGCGVSRSHLVGALSRGVAGVVWPSFR